MKDVIAVTTLAFVIRAAFANAWLHTVYAEVPFLDAKAYDEWARAIAGGAWQRSTAFYQSPLYPYVVGLIYAAFGHAPALITWLQTVLGAATCGMLAHTTGRHFGRAAGVAAGVLAAFDQALVFYTAPLMKETLGLALLAGFVHFGLRAREGPRVSALAGACLGLAALVRSNALVLGAPVAWALRRRPRRGLLPFGLTAVAVILPATVHNWWASRDFVPVNAGAGFNFYVGNSPSALNLVYPPGVSTDPAREEADVTRLAEARAGRALKPSEVSAVWMGEALDFLSHASWRERARLFVTKFRLFGTDAEIGDNYDPTFVAAHVIPGLRGACVSFGVLLVLAAAGLGAPRTAAERELWLMLAVYAASVVAFYVNDRYRLPAVIFLIPLAGRGVATVIAAVRDGRARAGVRLATAALPAAVWAFAPVGLRPAELDAFNWGLLASLHADAGHVDEATSAIERAIAVDPARVDGAAYVKGSTAFETRGDLGRARELLELNARVHADDGLAWFNLGRFAFEHGAHRVAAEHYEIAARVAPWLAQPHLGLAILHLSEGRRAAAADEVARGRTLDPGHAQLRALAELLR